MPLAELGESVLCKRTLAGREPEGKIAKGDYERVRREVSSALLEFTDPDTGRRPIAADALTSLLMR